MFEWEYKNVFGSEDMKAVNKIFSDLFFKSGIETIDRNAESFVNFAMKDKIKKMIKYLN